VTTGGQAGGGGARWQQHSVCSFQSSNLQKPCQQLLKQDGLPVRPEQQPDPLAAPSATIISISNFRITHLTGIMGIA
jgi:hypothetical protein